jgi:hypothetical protein
MKLPDGDEAKGGALLQNEEMENEGSDVPSFAARNAGPHSFCQTGGEWSAGWLSHQHANRAAPTAEATGGFSAHAASDEPRIIPFHKDVGPYCLRSGFLSVE